MSHVGAAVPLPGYATPFQFGTNCVVAFTAAATNRLLQFDLTHTDAGLEHELLLEAAHFGKLVRKELKPSLPTWDDVRHFSPPNKRRLYNSVIDVITGIVPDKYGEKRPGWRDYFGRGQGFVKFENYLSFGDDKLFNIGTASILQFKIKKPRPRMIVGRNLGMVIYMSRMMPYEHEAYGLLYDPNQQFRTMTKGLNSDEIGTLFLQKSSRFSKPRYLCGDCSSFDGHVSQAQLRAMHASYKAAMHLPKIYNKVFEAQLHNRVGSRLGVSFESEGRRMSGDRDTGYGNTVLTAIMIKIAMRHAHIAKYELLCDGDDFVLIVEDDQGDVAKAITVETYRGLGHDLSFDIDTLLLPEVEFCQKHPIRIDNDHCKLVRAPAKVLSTSVAGPTHFDTEAGYRFLMSAVGIGDYYVNSNVPVLGEYARMLYRLSTGKHLTAEQAASEVEEVRRSLAPSNPLFQRLVSEKRLKVNDIVTHSARMDFYLAYGMCPNEQQCYENYFRGVGSHCFALSTSTERHPMASEYGDVN